LALHSSYVKPLALCGRLNGLVTSDFVERHAIISKMIQGETLWNEGLKILAKTCNRRA